MTQPLDSNALKQGAPSLVGMTEKQMAAAISEWFYNTFAPPFIVLPFPGVDEPYQWDGRGPYEPHPTLLGCFYSDVSQQFDDSFAHQFLNDMANRFIRSGIRQWALLDREG